MTSCRLCWDHYQDSDLCDRGLPPSSPHRAPGAAPPPREERPQSFLDELAESYEGWTPRRALDARADLASERVRAGAEEASDLEALESWYRESAFAP